MTASRSEKATATGPREQARASQSLNRRVGVQPQGHPTVLLAAQVHD